MDDPARHHFTVHCDREIDAQILEDVTWIRGQILAEFPDARALFLVGGFGRGEGGVLRRADRWRPANDYDFELITTRRVEHQRLKRLGDRLAAELQIPFVHIENSEAWRQRLRGPSEYTVDLRLGSLALHDPRDMRTRLRRCVPERIPLLDALMTLFTRSSALLWHFEWPRDWSRAPESERFDLANQVSKALLAVEDAALIRSRAYHPSYRTRLERFEAVAPPAPLLGAVRWATDVKLRPGEAPLPDDLRSLWFETRDWHRAEVFRHATAMAGHPIARIEDLRTWLTVRVLPWWRRIALLGGGRRRAWETRIRLALANLAALDGLNQDGSVDDERLRLVASECEAFGRCHEGADWDSLRRALNALFAERW